MTERAADSSGGLVGARIRYEQTLRTLDRQAAVLGDLRSRANIVLSATGITASLFGARVLSSSAAGGLKAIALALVGLGLGACILVLAPVHDRGPMPANPRKPGARFGARRPRRWKVGLSANELRDATAKESEEAILNAMADLLTPARRLNYRTLEERSLALNAAALLLVLQVAAWSAALLDA